MPQAAQDCRSRRARSGCCAPADANAGQHTVGIHLSDGRVLSDVLVLERPSSMLAKRLELSRMYEVLVARLPVCF